MASPRWLREAECGNYGEGVVGRSLILGADVDSAPASAGLLSGVLCSRRLESLVFLLNLFPLSVHWYTSVGPGRPEGWPVRPTPPHVVVADRSVSGMNIRLLTLALD